MFFISTLVAKIISLLINLLQVGSGYTWPGHFVLQINPGIWKDAQKRLPSSIVFISGTNGKTTTSKLTSHILYKSGKRVINNKTGANLLNGVLSSILVNTDFFGNINADIAVFEVDEFSLSALTDKIKPSILALLNLSRDQLDRHWELELVLEKWAKVLEKLTKEDILVIDSTQSKIMELASAFKGKLLLFDASQESISETPLLGSFNGKNVNAALLIAEALGISKKTSLESLKDFNFAYGRGESTKYKNKNFKIFLAKNPESLNQNLMLLNENKIEFDTLLFVLNDKVPDGHDISWIYDVKPDLIKQVCLNKHTFVSGLRAYDMAIRLFYAGAFINNDNICEDIKKTLNLVVEKGGNNIVILPNYSSMLEVRKVILGRKIL